MMLTAPPVIPIIGNVTAAIALPHHSGYLPHRHIVVCHRPGMPEDRAYSTHEIALHPEHAWVAYSGHYEMPAGKAMADMVARAGYGPGHKG